MFAEAIGNETTAERSPSVDVDVDVDG